MAMSAAAGKEGYKVSAQWVHLELVEMVRSVCVSKSSLKTLSWPKSSSNAVLLNREKVKEPLPVPSQLCYLNSRPFSFNLSKQGQGTGRLRPAWATQ